ncbi:MAG: sulfatase-like hydrolase/transferase [Parvibaculaceae bacterium]
MGRKILFITTDQMRFDALGCNGGKVARTPAIDRLAKDGINYTRAHAQSVVCMPARSTILTGQYVSTHGVWMNGVPLPDDAPSVAAYLQEKAGYKTALFGKAHFEPFLDLDLKFYENRMARIGEYGPHRGFDHMELSSHTPLILHYNEWLKKTAPDEIGGFYQNLTADFEVNAAGGGDTGACQVHVNPVSREHYHTDWVADRTIAWLDGLDEDADWFCWMSFPDPHHPWDPPASEKGRVDWRDIDLPEAYPGSPDKMRAILETKPKHWMWYWTGERTINIEAPPAFVPKDMTPDQVREVNAMTHIENELIDEACAKVFTRIRERGWEDETDIIFTTDHGEFQGDYGLLFKGPYHVESLMKLPFIWKPAKTAGVPSSTVEAPVGQIDLAPTFCRIAGLDVPDWMQGAPLPATEAEASAQKRERVFTEWDSVFTDGSEVSLRTLYRDGYIITAYNKSNLYEGTEGELYNLAEDPHQWVNLWDDPASASLKSDLLADLADAHPPVRDPKLDWVAIV